MQHVVQKFYRIYLLLNQKRFNFFGCENHDDSTINSPLSI